METVEKREAALPSQVTRVTAIYQGGVLKPLQPLDYAENTKV